MLVLFSLSYFWETHGFETLRLSRISDVATIIMIAAAFKQFQVS